MRGGSVRAAAMLRALADAGHRVDLVAPHTDLPDHPSIRVLAGGDDKLLRRAQLRRECLRTARRVSYDAIHAVDQAVFFADGLSRWKKIPLVYDASRRFTGKAGIGTSALWKLFPKQYLWMETRALDRAVIIFSPCSALTADLYSLEKNAMIVQLEDIPIQPLYARREIEKSTLLESFGKRSGWVIVCRILPGSIVGFRKLLMAARKVIDAEPNTSFFFKGGAREQAEKMAASLDIAGHCVFLSNKEPETFLSALEIADAVLLVPQEKSRYIHPQVYTLLHAGAPLVTLHESAYDEVLSEKTSIPVLPSSESMAEGLLRVIQEPLFSLAVATEGQQLVADRYTYSSFKHKVRMTYHQLFKPE